MTVSPIHAPLNVYASIANTPLRSSTAALLPGRGRAKLMNKQLRVARRSQRLKQRIVEYSCMHQFGEPRTVAISAR